MADRHVRLVLPHQLFPEQLDTGSTAGDPDVLVLVEHDLLFRQYRFHQQKLVLHRASMRRFAERLRDEGREVEVIETDGRTTSRAALVRLLTRVAATRVTWFDVAPPAPAPDAVIGAPQMSQ